MCGGEANTPTNGFLNVARLGKSATMVARKTRCGLRIRGAQKLGLIVLSPTRCARQQLSLRQGTLQEPCTRQQSVGHMSGRAKDICETWLATTSAARVCMKTRLGDCLEHHPHRAELNFRRLFHENGLLQSPTLSPKQSCLNMYAPFYYPWEA